MDQGSAKLENELSRITSDAKTIMLLSLISIVVTPLYLIALLYFLFYFNKRKNLYSDQSLSSISSGLKGKTTKELRSCIRSSNSLEQKVAGSILAHKTMVAVLIVVGIIIAITVGIIIIYS